jgi:hypothetical protein
VLKALTPLMAEVVNRGFLRSGFKMGGEGSRTEPASQGSKHVAQGGHEWRGEAVAWSCLSAVGAGGGSDKRGLHVSERGERRRVRRKAEPSRESIY